MSPRSIALVDGTYSIWDILRILQQYIHTTWPELVDHWGGPVTMVHKDRVVISFAYDWQNICPVEWLTHYAFDPVVATKEAVERHLRGIKQ